MVPQTQGSVISDSPHCRRPF